MRFSKKHQVLLFSSVAVVTAAFALSQDFMRSGFGKLSKQTARKAAEKWKNKLSLSAGQGETLQKTLEKFGLEKDKIIQSKMPKKLMKEQMHRLRTLENEEIKNIFSQSQYERYEKMLRK